MKKRTRTTAAHLLAKDYVEMKAEKDMSSSLQQIKHEETLDKIYDHYYKRIGIMFQLLILVISCLAYVAMQ
jgi:hypothetical protein